uniref:Uncharacterized protein n=1 Tax=Octopus bimaculoides TaxID=37653 RepID=A0A0L8GRC1_OCTBM
MNMNFAMQRSFGMDDLGVPRADMGIGCNWPTLSLSCTRYLLTSGFDFLLRRNSPGTVHHFCGRSVEIFLWSSADSQHHPWMLINPIGPIKSSCQGFLQAAVKSLH